jgi:ribosome biogenesis protein ENP2
MKFSRHMDSEIVDFQILSEDWQKLAIICRDRSVNLHSRFGLHYRTRTPKVGRSLSYFAPTVGSPPLPVMPSNPQKYICYLV